jgi:hypothetical protein
LVESKLVLAQDAHFFGARDGALGRLELASEDFHESGFAGAIGSGNGVTAPGHKSTGDVLEEDARSEAHRDIVDRKHNPPIVA